MKGIVITGIGVISPLGIGRKAFWQGCLTAQSGIRRITGFDARKNGANIAAPVRDFDPGAFMPRGRYRRMSGLSRMTAAAACEALEDSGLEMEGIDKDTMAVVMGTSYGSSSSVNAFFESLLQDGPRGAQPIYFPETVPNAPAGHIAMLHGITGPNTTFCQNEISAENALLYARNLIRQHDADIVLAGGGEELSQTLYDCYNALGALNKVKVEGKRQDVFPEGRGLVLGEGAAVLVMEKAEAAHARGAFVYGKLLSAAVTGGPAPTGHYDEQGDQLERVIRLALQEAGLDAEGIDQVDISSNLSGELESLEYRVLKRVFSDSKGSPGAVSPLKYLLGDSGAAGAQRAAAVLLSLRNQTTLPRIDVETLRHDPPGPPEWDIPGRAPINTTLMLSSTFGGGHCALIFSRKGFQP